MITHPKIKYCYHAEFIDQDKILLISEKDKLLLSGKPYSLILNCIQNEDLSIDELITRLDGQLSIFEIHYVLGTLESKGYITQASPTLPPEANAYWNTRRLEGNNVQQILNERTVSIESLGTLDPSVLATFLTTFNEIGIQTHQRGDLRIIITGNYQFQQLASINQSMLEAQQPWLLIKPVGVELWMGPLFIPGHTGCWECLNQRLTINNPIDTFYKTQTGGTKSLTVPVAAIPTSIGIAARQAALEVVQWLYSGISQSLQGKIVTIDTHTLQNKFHTLIKRPQCPICGQPNKKNLPPEPINLRKRSSFCVSTAGGYREQSPEDTLEKYRHHISPITGVVRSLQSYHSAPDSPIYNISSGPNTALRSKTLYWLNSHIRSANGGKGKSWSQAKAGALCEGIERYSMTYQGDEQSFLTSLDKLGKDGIHPNHCMNYSQNQYLNRDTCNRECAKLFALVPALFDPSREIDWTPVYSLTENRFKYLPTAFCYTQYPSDDETQLFSYPDSNGCAAGNSIEEAILQGFLELVERDSVAIWWYNRIQRPQVDLKSFYQPYFIQLIHYYKSIGRHLYVLDLTSDFQIPTFVAASYRITGAEEEKIKENILFGFGAHVDATLAIERALVELNQLLPIAEAPGTDWRNGKYLTDENTFFNWLEHATLDNQPFFKPQEDSLMKKAHDYPPLCPADVYDSLIYCLNRSTELGMETLVLDLTRKDIALPVVRVFVPGMRHFWRRLGPGRLYDAPLKMDLIEKSLKEEELNPIGLFI
jgi:oxazoline/thiazoline synthase